MSMRLKRGDPVIVIAGNDKGKEGLVKAIKGERIVVGGVNMRKKHQKGQQGDKKGGKIVEFEAPLNISNVMYCVEGKGYKLRARINDAGKKELYCKTSDKSEKVIRTV